MKSFLFIISFLGFSTTQAAELLAGCNGNGVTIKILRDGSITTAHLNQEKIARPVQRIKTHPVFVKYQGLNFDLQINGNCKTGAGLCGYVDLGNEKFAVACSVGIDVNKLYSDNQYSN